MYTDLAPTMDFRPRPPTSAIAPRVVLLILPLVMVNPAVDAAPVAASHLGQRSLDRRQTAVPAIVQAVELSSAADPSLVSRIQAQALVRACGFLDAMPTLIPLPHICVTDDGDFGFTWLKGANSFDVLVDSEAFGWTRQIGGNYMPGWDIEGDDPVDWEPILKELASFHGIERTVSG